MAAIYMRQEQTNLNLYDPGLYVVDYKGALDASWEGYTRGYNAARAIIENGKNDFSWVMSTMGSMKGGGGGGMGGGMGSFGGK